MVKLTSEMQAIFREQLAIIATASSNGIPNVVPKGSMHVIDDETLVYSEGRCEKTLRNIRENPRVAVVVIDMEKVVGYQIKGTAELITGGDLFLDMANRQRKANRPQPEFVVKIKVKEIYPV